ncbi:MAG: 30S ribosome-binding factor RbfA [Armatimonadota bacterium]|nr:30S ribosome-binding factor RbfA [Armatimonadota bacterium]
MASQRIRRVQNLLRSEISNVVHLKLKDPRVGMITITEVESDADLKHARVFVSVFGNREQRDSALAGLTSGAGFIRSELMKVLHLRPMPVLDFRADQSLARAARTLELLDQISHEQDNDEPRPRPGDRSDSEE